MLSHDERRRFAEIESYLRATDPEFLARARVDPAQPLLDTSLPWCCLTFGLMLVAAAGRPVLAIVLGLAAAALNVDRMARRVRAAMAARARRAAPESRF